MIFKERTHCTCAEADDWCGRWPDGDLCCNHDPELDGEGP